MPHYFIDGYNLLFALPEMPTGAWMDKRQKLLHWLIDHSPQGNNPMTVVFDSRQGLGDRESIGGLEVVYTAGETADDWIIRKVRQISNPRAAVVVSDDQGIRHMIRGTGARWQAATEFVDIVRRSNRPRPNPSSNLDHITEEMKRNWL